MLKLKYQEIHQLWVTKLKLYKTYMIKKKEKIIGTEIKSPIIGTAYLAPEPGGKKFVEIGKKIKRGYCYDC